MRFTERQERLYRFLQVGWINAKTAKQIEKGTGIKYRAVYDVVKQLRKKGIPIVSERFEYPQGYYIAEREKDVERNRLRIESEIIELQKTLKYLKENEKSYLVNREVKRHEKSFIDYESSVAESKHYFINKNRICYKLGNGIKVIINDQSSGYDYEVYKHEELVRVGYNNQPYSFSIEKLLKEIKKNGV